MARKTQAERNADWSAKRITPPATQAERAARFAELEAERRADAPILIRVTPAELDEIISCVDAALYAGLAYGHVTQAEQSAAELERRALLDKLEALTPREGPI